MGWFTRLLGIGGSGRKINVNEETTREKKIAHRQRNELVVQRLRELGVKDGQPLRLEFFFYAERAEAADALAMALQRDRYDVELGHAADKSGLFVVTGWTVPISVSPDAVNEWCDRMNDLGLAHNCEFDGWGTSPEQ
jgi:hypothetical protein